MSSKVEQQYKLLNAQLMDHVQKQRIEIGMYKRELITLKHENMELREERIMQDARQREERIAILKSLMLRFEMDPKCLTDFSQSIEDESKSSEASSVVSRRSQNRRSSREICQEMRQSSALARSSRTISPTRRRDSLPQEEPTLANSTPPQTVAEEANNSSSRIIFPTRRRHAVPEESIEASESTLTPPPEGEGGSNGNTVSPTRRRNIISEQLTPKPRRVAEITLDSSTEEEEEQESTSAAQEEQEPAMEEEHRPSAEDLGTIIEDSYGETSPSDYSSPFSGDSSIENHTWSRRALSSIDPNVLASGGMQTRAKCKSTNNSTEEQPSIQMPRLLVTGSSPTLVESLIRNSSFDRSDATKLSPRRNIFSGTFQMSGTNTSTPIATRSAPQNNTTVNKTSEGLATTRKSESKVKLRNPKLDPKQKGVESAGTSSRSKEHKKSGDQTTDLSTTCCSTSGRRPSRKCRPTQLSEPNLRDKMRNSTEEKKRSYK